MSEKIKVMHVINNMEVGGAERMLVLLANELSKRDDIEVYIVSLEGHGPLSKNLSGRVIYKEFKYHLFTPILRRLDPYFRLGLYFYAHRIKPDIIHGHLFKGEGFAKLLGALMHKPVLITLHDTLSIPGKKVRFLNRHVTKAIAVSKVVAQHLTRVYGIKSDKVIIIPNAIDAQEFGKGTKTYNQAKPVFIYIGRLLESKGVDDAIIGLAKLQPEYPGIKLLIYGKAVHDSYKRYLEGIVKRNKWNFVEFMGRTDDVPAALKNGDIFVLPSQTEGFAISVLEAAAAGKPAIATKTGAIPEIVIDGVSGVLIDWHKPDQIYRAAKDILDNDLVKQYGEAAQKIAREKFDIKKVSGMLYDLYRSING